jgi:hypothetical protein
MQPKKTRRFEITIEGSDRVFYVYRTSPKPRSNATPWGVTAKTVSANVDAARSYRSALDFFRESAVSKEVGSTRYARIVLPIGLRTDAVDNRKAPGA